MVLVPTTIENCLSRDFPDDVAPTTRVGLVGDYITVRKIDKLSLNTIKQASVRYWTRLTAYGPAGAGARQRSLPDTAFDKDQSKTRRGP